MSFGFICVKLQNMENVKKRFRLSPSMQIVLGFILIILLGAFLLCLPISHTNGEWFNFFDSLFTSTSAVCITGLAVVNFSTAFSLFGQIVILLLIQIGGLGIVSITSLIFLILGKKINLSNRLTLKESLNRENIQGVVKFIKKVIIITLTIELVGALVLLYSTTTYYNSFAKGLFSAIFLSISSFCNAGIDVFGSDNSLILSLSGFSQNVLMLLPIIFLIILGGIGFVVLIDGFKNFKFKQHTKVVLWTTGVLLVLGTVLFLIFEWNNPNTLGNMPFGYKLLNALFQSTTTRSAGFATLDQSALTPASRILTLVLMFIGGSPNSTAGGIKTTTFFIILLFTFKKSNDNGDITFKERKISNKIITKAIKIFLFAILMLIVSICVIRIIEPSSISLEGIIFECVSALTTVGLSMGITASLTTASQVIITILMFAGRIGLTTFALVVSSKANTTNKIEYTNTDIIIG